MTGAETSKRSTASTGFESEDKLTEAVVARVRQADDPRVRQVSEALVRHLHAFIKEIEPTEGEWMEGIKFLTNTGQTCSETRQEFILLSDVLGVSMLVDAINHRLPSSATETTVLGPFYVEPPAFKHGDHIGGEMQGAPFYIGGTVRDGEGKAIANAQVDVWHTDNDGFYDLQKLDQLPGLAGRGRFVTDAAGRFHLWTVRPSPYPLPNDGPVGAMLRAQKRHPYRPEHVHFMIAAPGHRTLVTHVFADGDQYLDSDVVFGVKDSLIREYEARDGGFAPDGSKMSGAWVELNHDFVLAAA